MYEKEVTFAGNPSNQKFLREKRKSSLKFKAKNWDFGRKEWNNYHWKFFSFASRSYWPISEGKKKNLIKEFCYRGEEKHGEIKREKKDS